MQVANAEQNDHVLKRIELIKHDQLYQTVSMSRVTKEINGANQKLEGNQTQFEQISSNSSGIGDNSLESYINA